MKYFSLIFWIMLAFGLCLVPSSFFNVFRYRVRFSAQALRPSCTILIPYKKVFRWWCMRAIKTGRVAQFVLGLILLTNGESYSQEDGSNRDLVRLIGNQLHEFFDQQGRVVGVGRVVSLSDKKLAFVDGFDKRNVHDISDLSNQDRSYCREIEKQLEVIKRSRKSAEKIEKQLLSGKTKNQVRACVQLRKLGIAASGQLPILLSLTVKSNDPAVAYESLISYALLCDTTIDNLNFVLKHGATLNGRLVHRVQSNPQDFLLSVSRWQNDSIPFLKQVAFTGESVWNSDVKEHAKGPVDLSTTEGEKNVTRRLACTALGNVPSFHSGPKLGTVALLIAVHGKANKQINNRKDEKTVIAILNALGNIGSRISEVYAIFSRHESTYPEVVKSAKATLLVRTSLYQENYRLQQGSVMRSFKSNQGKYFWGNLQSTENGNAILRDRSLSLISIPISQFSKTDREYIVSTFPLKDKE